MFNPKQAGGGGGQNLPTGQLFLLSKYKPVPWDMHCCHWGGSLFTSVSNKHCGAKMRVLCKSFPGPLLKLGMGPLARYSNHQEIVNRRPEQMYTSFDTRLEWPREGSLF